MFAIVWLTFLSKTWSILKVLILIVDIFWTLIVSYNVWVIDILLNFWCYHEEIFYNSVCITISWFKGSVWPISIKRSDIITLQWQSIDWGLIFQKYAPKKRYPKKTKQILRVLWQQIPSKVYCSTIAISGSKKIS